MGVHKHTVHPFQSQAQLLLLVLMFLHDTDAASCDGSINIELSGGTAPYSVSWNAAGAGMQIINLCETETGLHSHCDRCQWLYGDL